MKKLTSLLSASTAIFLGATITGCEKNDFELNKRAKVQIEALVANLNQLQASSSDPEWTDRFDVKEWQNLFFDENGFDSAPPYITPVTSNQKEANDKYNSAMAGLSIEEGVIHSDVVGQITLGYNNEGQVVVKIPKCPNQLEICKSWN